MLYGAYLVPIFVTIHYFQIQMKKLIIVLLGFIISHCGFSQAGAYDRAMEQLTENFNEGEYDAIFDQFSSEMKKALPKNDADQFFTGLLNQAGRIEESEFKGFLQGTYATYKTDFDRMVLAVNISVNEEEKINGFFIGPYDEDEIEGAEAVNTLGESASPIGDLVYERARVFPNHTQLSIAVIRNGEPTYLGVIKERDTLKTIENKDSIFEIGSLTKVFTSSVLASFVEAGMLELEAPINPFYPFPFHGGYSISFESLANHTSGLPALPGNFDFTNEENPYKNYGVEELNTFLRDSLQIDYEEEPGYTYSNLGAGLLAHSLEVASQVPFRKLLKDRILNRFDMHETYTDNDGLDGLVKGLDVEGKVIPNWDFDVLFGAGGMLSTTVDLVKFVQAQFNPDNRDLALTRKLTHKIDDALGIGLGWHISRSVGHNDLYWQNGGTGGYRSTLVLDPITKSGVVILSNVSAFHPKDENIDELGFDIIKEVMGD